MLITFLKSNTKKQTGFTLIEILVSLLILSIGLLGLAALQLTGMKNNQSSHYRSLATNLSNDIADRIRANRGETYSIALAAAPAGTITDCESSTADCTTAQMATFDIANWKCALGNWNTNNTCDVTLLVEGNLPSGDGSITPDTPSAGIYTIIVKWDDTRSGSADTEFTMEFLP